MILHMLVLEAFDRVFSRDFILLIGGSSSLSPEVLVSTEENEYKILLLRLPFQRCYDPIFHLPH